MLGRVTKLILFSVLLASLSLQGCSYSHLECVKPIADDENDPQKSVDCAESFAEEFAFFVGEPKDTEPIHAETGEWVEATGNLAVSIDSVEEGPYDYADQTPTVKVAVSMKNLTDNTIVVKASNWNADNSNGERVDHKLWICDSNGEICERSFEVTRVSPRSTFKGIVYFDGSSLVDVVYEPHWLLSRQNQCIYFNL